LSGSTRSLAGEETSRFVAVPEARRLAGLNDEQFQNMHDITTKVNR
jgi:hypothetical protein